MASASEQLDGKYGSYTGDMSYVDNSPMSFNDYWSIYAPMYGHVANSNPYSFWNRLGNFFTGGVSTAEQDYQNYLSEYESKRNDQKAAYANWQTQQREDSSVQRALGDYKAAGLNPYLILNGGSGISANSSVAQYSAHKRGSESKDKDNDNKILSTALKVLALIVMKKS